MTKLIAVLLIGAAGTTAAVTQAHGLSLPPRDGGAVELPVPPEPLPPAPPPGFGWHPGFASPPGFGRHPTPRILCQRPRSLRLRRFEDRSAVVLCAGRTLVRIAVPS